MVVSVAIFIFANILLTAGCLIQLKNAVKGKSWQRIPDNCIIDRAPERLDFGHFNFWKWTIRWNLRVKTLKPSGAYRPQQNQQRWHNAIWTFASYETSEEPLNIDRDK
jgi:hypothetical protein